MCGVKMFGFANLKTSPKGFMLGSHLITLCSLFKFVTRFLSIVIVKTNKWCNYILGPHLIRMWYQFKFVTRLVIIYLICSKDYVNMLIFMVVLC